MTAPAIAPNATTNILDTIVAEHENTRGTTHERTLTPAEQAARDLLDQATEAHDRNVKALTERVAAIKNAKLDAVADTRALTAVAVPAGDNHPAQVIVQAPNGLRMRLSDVAHDQLATHCKIDRRYYDRMQAGAPDLLATNLNWWLTNTPAERLLRMLRPDAYATETRREMASLETAVTLRGFMGKGYRTIDDADLVDAVLPSMIAHGAKLADFSIDDRRMVAKFFTTPRDVLAIKQAYADKYGIPVADVGRHLTVNGQDISWVNETLSTGLVIRHSEVGFASLSASFVTRIMKCLNDYVAENAIAIRHVGGKNGKAEDMDVRYVSDAAQALDNAALLARVQDTIALELSDDKQTTRALSVLGAKVERVAVPAAMPLFEFVGNVGSSLGLTLDETELLKEETTRAIIEEGGPVKFAFVQGITAVARQMTDYDRRLDVERTGFALLTDEASALLALGRNAEKRAKARAN